MIFDQADRNPDGLALDDLTCQRTWAELADRSTRIARFLLEDLGLRPDDHAALLMRNCSEYIELTLGAFLAGIWLTPVNGHLAPKEMRTIVEDSGSRVLFTDAHHAEVAHTLGAPRVMIAGPELEAAIASASPRPMDLAGPVGGTMIYTSGTTGRPKGVKRKRAASVSAALEQQSTSATRLGLDGRGPHLVTGPLYHAAPLLFAIYDQGNGAPLLIMPRWDESHALELIVEREIAHTHMVPTMFIRLLRLPEEVRRRFSAPALRLVLHGAAPISVTVKTRMIDWWGEKLVEYWGATEGGVNTLIDSADWLAHPGSVGRTLPSFEVFAVDGEGRRLPSGETGDLYCRHKEIPDVFEYHQDPEKTAGAYLEPGVFTIGDIGHVDVEGYVYLSDRRSNMIISGGVNIYPAEIENVLQEHPAVADVGVFGIPDDEWGESVKAAVELVAGETASPQLAEEILSFGRQRLAHYKLPRSIDFETSLPRHPTGKLYIRRLKDRYWSGRERKI